MKTVNSHRISLIGTQLSTYTQEEILAHLHQAITTQEHITVLSGNIYSFNLAYENEWLRNYFNQADTVRLDGAGLRFGAWILGYETPERMTWADFGWALAAFAARHDHSLYLIGAKKGIAEKAASRLVECNPSLRIAGIHHGYFSKQLGNDENEAVIQQINTAKPDILIVGFGMPIQERWLMENRTRICASVVITGGAVFDYLSGELRRGPAILTNNGFEWLARMIIEPSRLWKRYVIGNPLFVWRVLKQKFGLLSGDRVV